MQTLSLKPWIYASDLRPRDSQATGEHAARHEMLEFTAPHIPILNMIWSRSMKFQALEMKYLLVFLAFMPSIANAKKIPFPPPAPSFQSRESLGNLPSSIFDGGSKLFVYFGNNMESFFRYYDQCLISAHDKAKSPFLGTDLFGDYKAMREGIEAIAPRALFAARLKEEASTRFLNVEFATDEVEAIALASKSPDSVILAFDMLPEKECTDEGGSAGPLKFKIESFVYNATFDRKCHVSKLLKYSDAYRAGGGRFGLLPGLTMNYRELPTKVSNGYGNLAFRDGLQACLKSV